MRWQTRVYVLGAVLLCTGLLAGSLVTGVSATQPPLVNANSAQVDQTANVGTAVQAVKPATLAVSSKSALKAVADKKKMVMTNMGPAPAHVSKGHVLTAQRGDGAILYAPTQADNPTFRAEVAAITGAPCDYWDSIAATPTLVDLEPYDCVFTWVNSGYENPIAMGDVLADYLEAGGKVILGQWTEEHTQTNWLQGRIMTDYAIVDCDMASFDAGVAYSGDGVMCPHVGVTAYDSDYRDHIATVIPPALSDGTYTDGYISVVMSPVLPLFYSAGNTGGTFGTGEWALLTANMCACTTDPVYVACCDEASGDCVDSVDMLECIDSGGRFEFGVEFCADLVPPCGAQIGACCCGEAGEAGVCEPFECIGDMTAAVCLALGEETNWTEGESCDAVPPFGCYAPTYCDGDGGCDEFIDGVELGDIANMATGCSGYADYTGISTYLLYGVDYDLTVTNGNYWSTDITTVWIDWNQDKDFDDADEMVSSGDPGGAIYTDTISVAAGALAGPTRMRIRIQYGGTPDPCGSFTYGEVEDYTVIIGDPPPYGACCVDAVCMWSETMDEAACDLEGGVYQGDGTDCDPNPCIGACCYPDGSCEELTEAGCFGEYLGDGTGCIPNPCTQPPPDCPPLSLFSQVTDLPDGDWSIATSDAGSTEGYIVYENYEVLGQIHDVHWWGLSLVYSAGWSGCEELPGDFNIAFWDDDGGQPAAVPTCEYVVSAMPTPTGLLFSGFELMSWEVILPEDCALMSGWVSIQGAVTPDPACWFLWASSHEGDLQSWQWDGTALVSQAFDRGVCLTGEYIPEFGACCDATTGVCTDGVEIVDCQGFGMQFSANTMCAELDPPCGNFGACCDDSTGDCVDGVLELACDGRHVGGALCADLPFDPPCGLPGACCIDDPMSCTDDVFAADCAGRHIVGATCADELFDPPCGEWVPVGMLYAPTEEDSPEFRAAVSAHTGSPCDYYDPRLATPTLEFLQDYACVMTWGNYAYFDAVAMGDVLADYVDAGGKVILGQWTYHTTQVNWLEGRIMEPEYCPITATSYSTTAAQAYAGDGVDCVHAVGPVVTYDSNYRDQITPIAGAFSDGTFLEDGMASVAWRADRKVYYSAGNTGGTYATGGVADWGLLTANMCLCAAGDLYGACCDPYTGICESDILMEDCEAPLVWTYDTHCDDLIPPCGNIGACCDIYTGDCTDNVFEINCQFDRFEGGGECAELNPLCGTPGCCCEAPESGEVTDPVESLEANCDGRFLPGVTGAECVAEAFEPECGLYECSGILYAPTEEDSIAFRDAVATASGQACDYYDPRLTTPTLEDLADYCCVFTWGNYAYADPVAMGDVLADYVDGGGKVILGQWTYHTTQVNWLEGRIMEPEYCPITAAGYSTTAAQAYAGDGVDCVHAIGPVTAYDTDYRDQITPIAGAFSDGTFLEDGLASVAWRADRKVYYSAGNTGGTYATGGIADWGQLVANMCSCAAGDLFGACCDPYTGVCTDDVLLDDCQAPLQWTYNTLCDDLVPPCGNIGACCDEASGVCTDDVFEIACEGDRFYGGTQCAELDPLCGEVYGACCYEETCLYERPSECTGEYMGDGVPCDPNPCLCTDLWMDAPGCIDGDTTGAGDDCALRAGEEQIVAVTIPYESTWAFSLCGGATWDTYMFVGTTCCGQEVGYNDDDCYYGPYAARALQSEVRALVGAGTYYVDIEPYSEATVGPYTLCVFDTLGACCDDLMGVCVDGELVDNCFDDNERFEGGVLCADMDPPCVEVEAACCVGPECTMLTASACEAAEGTWYFGEDCATFECPVGGCEHTVTLWDDYGDGWNGGLLDVLVNGIVVLDDLTIATGFGPESHVFMASPGDAITTVYVAGSWAYENSYCIYGGEGEELGCDGLDGVEPTAGIEVEGACPFCDHTVTLWDDYGDGWNGGLLDVLVNGLVVLDDLTIATGFGPESHTFTAATDDVITTVYVAGSWAYENSYCIYDGFMNELGCDGLGGVEPTAGIEVIANCEGANFVAAKSWKTHGAAGALYIDMPGIETRWDGVTELELEYDGVPVLPLVTDIVVTGNCPLQTFNPDSVSVVGNSLFLLFDAGMDNGYGGTFPAVYTLTYGTLELDMTVMFGNVNDTGGSAGITDASDVNHIIAAHTGGALVTQANCEFDVWGPASYSLGQIDSVDANRVMSVLPMTMPVPENDLCEDATWVEGPYPVTVYGDNTCATIDCPGLLDWEATWWEIDLPYASNNLDIDYCPTMHGEQPWLTGGIVVYVDCTDCAAYDIADYYHFDAYCPEQNLSMGWVGLPGPGTILFPAFYKAGADELSAVPIPYGLNINVTEAKGGRLGSGSDDGSTTASTAPRPDKKKSSKPTPSLGTSAPVISIR